MNALLYLIRAYPRQNLIVVACLMAAALAEGLGIVTAVPLLGLAIDPERVNSTGAGREVAAFLETWLPTIGLRFDLMSVGLVVTVLIWLKAGLLMLTMRRVGNTVAWIATDLRLAFLRQQLAADWSYFSRHSLGRLTNAVGTEAQRAADAYRQLALAAKYACLSLVAVSAAIWISPRLAAATLLGCGVIGLALGGLVRLARRAGQKQTTVINDLLSHLSDALLNAKLFKTMHRERLIEPMLAQDTKRLEKALRKQVLAQESLNALQEPLIFMIVVATLAYSQQVETLGFEATTVMLLALVRGLTAVTKIQRRYQFAVTQAPALESLLSLMREAENAREHLPTGPAPQLTRAIRVEDVDFAHDELAVLRGASLEVPAGEITVLTGESGGGKSTLVDLITGLVRAQRGEVRIDDTPITELDVASWRQGIGYVPQETILLNDTLRRNVTLGDDTIEDDAVEVALRDAQLWDWVSRQPQGLDAAVGERGSLLSGGQRARVALARALVVRPSLVILDEATAALDPQTEERVMATIAALRGRTTILAISHQPAIRKIADRVYRIAGGQAELQEQAER